MLGFILSLSGENGQFWFWGAFNLDVGCFSAKRESDRVSEGEREKDK